MDDFMIQLILILLNAAKHHPRGAMILTALTTAYVAITFANGFVPVRMRKHPTWGWFFRALDFVASSKMRDALGTWGFPGTSSRPIEPTKPLPPAAVPPRNESER